MAISALLGLGLMWATEADARPHHHQHVRPRPRVAVARPGVRVSVRASQWAVSYRPGARPGYIWVGAAWVGSRYVAGHWRPTTPPPRSDYVWVEGHWEDDTYIDGYWRIDDIDGMIWVDGEYAGDDEYVEGHWEDPAGHTLAPEQLPEEATQPTQGSLAVPWGAAPEYDEVEVEEPEPDAPAPDLHHAPPERW